MDHDHRHVDGHRLRGNPVKVCIYTNNHGSAAGIADIVSLLKCGAHDSGYSACISNQLMPGHCNVLIEHFVTDEELRTLQRCKTPGTRYVLVGTEIITGDTFNAELNARHPHYSNAAYWKTRFDGFMAASRLADAVWVLSDLAVKPYQTLLPDKPVRFLPHAHVNHFDLVHHRDEAHKDIEFYFSGNLTDSRREILAALARKHSVVCNAQATPDYLRMDQMARAKVCLSMPLSPDNTLPSVSRMHFHLQNRNFLLHQAHPQASILDPYVLHAPPGDFVEWALAALAIDNRRAIADGALARFRAELPMARWMQPLLAEATGHAPTRNLPSSTTTTAAAA